MKCELHPNKTAACTDLAELIAATHRRAEDSLVPSEVTAAFTGHWEASLAMQVSGMKGGKKMKRQEEREEERMGEF